MHMVPHDWERSGKKTLMLYSCVFSHDSIDQVVLCFNHHYALGVIKFLAGRDPLLDLSLAH
jgi:hypothetical protein